MLVFHAPTPWDLSEQEDLALHSFLPSPHVWQALLPLLRCVRLRSAARLSRRAAVPSTTAQCSRSSAACPGAGGPAQPGGVRARVRHVFMDHHVIK
jgi:hypothetical protein